MPSTFVVGLLHADGKLYVYFKNRFATLHIPTLNLASSCLATLIGTLLSGAETRGCLQQTTPLDFIVPVVPEPIPTIRWNARPWETQVDVFSVLSSVGSCSVNSYSFALHSISLPFEDQHHNSGNPKLFKNSIQQLPTDAKLIQNLK